ncbi:MAG: dTDP-4-dehydrorhamnose 3,5-epimerase [Ferruginibacter sp.]|jgi:dTDP-4-dehydrorhamnose 3,5-epimerase
MPFKKTGISGLMIFEPVVLHDSRGYFFESYNEHTCQTAGVHYRFIQDNQALSSYGVVRGLHYQLDPHSQAKFVRVLSGTILDVAVDIRRGSPTFGQHFSIELSADNKTQLLIPPGFAHGYSVLSETAEVFYKCDAPYKRESETGIRYDDPSLGIDWRIPKDRQIISEKDQRQPLFAESLNNFIFKP